MLVLECRLNKVAGSFCQEVTLVLWRVPSELEVRFRNSICDALLIGLW